MFYILYQVTNNVNGKIYVGVHKTKKLDDGYMGSGKVINAAIKKYGIENFTRIILEQFEDSTAMYAREKEIVTEEFLAREDTYNLRRGGFGGFDYINSVMTKTDRSRYGRISGHKRGTDSFKKKLGMFGMTPEQRSECSKRGGKNNISRHGCNFSILNSDPEFQSKRKAAFKESRHQQGEKNSQFGKMWITNEIENKKILKTALVPEGWRAGRIMPKE